MNLLIATIALLAAAQQDREYEPLETWAQVKTVDLQFKYGDRNRSVPLRIYLPEGQKGQLPVLLFSHGLGGSRDTGSKYLGNHWAGRGYAVVCMQHAGSDTDVVKNAPRGKKMGAMLRAASAESTLNRFEDAKATISHLEHLNNKPGEFANRFDLAKLGMSGHSFGAITTQGMSGQKFGRRGQLYTDKRIKASIALSPSPPNVGSSSDAFGTVEVPWLLMTGTKDESRVRNTTAADRRIVFRELPKSGHFYELVLDGAEHMAFSDRRLLGGKHRNANHHKTIKSISTAFWDAHLLDNAAAKTWLNGPGPRSILVTADAWSRK